MSNPDTMFLAWQVYREAHSPIYWGQMNM